MMTASLLIGLVLLMTPVLRSAAAAADAGNFSDAVSSLSSTSLPHALRRAINGINTAHLHYYIPVCVKKGSPYLIIERRVPELISVLCSQPAGDVSHKPGGRLPLLSARPAVAPATLKRAATNFAAWRT